VIDEDATLPPAADGLSTADPPDAFAAAIRTVAELAMALSSAIADVAFADAARLRGEVGHALCRAANLAAQLANDEDRQTAAGQLIEMRGVTSRIFEVAPTPSPAAIAAAETGDRTAWIREEQAWIASRLASGTNPRIPRPQRHRRETLPDSPRALGLASRASPDRDGAPAQPGRGGPSSTKEGSR
jgi:hypothetical protein